MVFHVFTAFWWLKIFRGMMLYLWCSCSIFCCSSSLQWINRTALFRTVCIFLFCVKEAIHIGIVGYVSTGINKVLIKVVFSVGVKLLNLLSWDKTPLPLFIVFVIWPVKPVELILRPSSLPFLQVSISFQLTVIFWVLCCAIGIILNFSSLVFIFHCL